MINEEQKHIADVFKIASFALMTPLGKVVLSIPDLSLRFLNMQFISFVIIWHCFILVGCENFSRIKAGGAVREGFRARNSVTKL